MGEFLLQLARFAMIALVGYSLILAVGLISPAWERQFIVRSNDFGGLNRRAAEWNARVHAGLRNDVIFLGSSTCYSGIDPASLEAYGLEGFNLCSSGQPLEVTERLLGPVLSTGRPKAIVLDLYGTNWPEEWPVSAACPRDWIVNGGLGTGVLGEALLPISTSTWDPFTLILAAYFQVRPYFALIGSRAIPDANGTYVARGYFKRTYSSLKAHPLDRECTTAAPTCFESIHRMSDVCNAAGVAFILLHPPVLGCQAIPLPPELKHVQVIDGNAWPGKKDFTNYYDDHHLVHRGAQSYSTWLAAQVADLSD